MDQNQRRRIMERHIIRRVLAHLRAAGWAAWRTFDGDEFVAMQDDNHVVAVAGNLDEVSVRFVPASLAASAAREACIKTEHGVLFVMGNGEDVLSDWSYRDGDPDGFNAQMDALDIERIVDNFAPSKAAHADQIAILAGSWLPGNPRAVLFIGKGGIRRLGECDAIESVDALLVANGLIAERISRAEVDAYPNGWRKEVFIAHA